MKYQNVMFMGSFMAYKKNLGGFIGFSFGNIVANILVVKDVVRILYRFST